jgi:hypothetical protein
MALVGDTAKSHGRLSRTGISAEPVVFILYHTVVLDEVLPAGIILPAPHQSLEASGRYPSTARARRSSSSTPWFLAARADIRRSLRNVCSDSRQIGLSAAVELE